MQALGEVYSVLLNLWADCHELLVCIRSASEVLHMIVAIAEQGQRRTAPGEFLSPCVLSK
jgi:hypothetical protein